MSLPNPDWFADAEAAAMLRSAHELWWRAFIELALASGLRVNEQLRLHWSDIDPRTSAVRVTSEPVVDPVNSDAVTLRTPLPPHRERFVPIQGHAMKALDALRADRPEDTHVFVPEWMLDRLWTRIVAGERLTPDALAPRINGCFRRVQRLARHALASALNLPLNRVSWRPRPLDVLRHTYAQRASRLVPPSTLKELLGYASVRPVLPYYDHVRAATSGGVM